MITVFHRDMDMDCTTSEEALQSSQQEEGSKGVIYITGGKLADISSWYAVKTFLGFINNQPHFTIKRGQKMY